MVTSRHWSDGCQTNPATTFSACEKKIHTTQCTYIFICRKFGQRKSWHLVGLVCTLVSFPFIFQPCIISAEAQAIYYAVLTVVYCFGWASQQVNKSGETWHNDKYFMYIRYATFL